MLESNPIEMLDPRLRLIGFVVILCLNLYVIGLMAPYNTVLKVGDIEKPIIGFEMAGTVEKAQGFIDTWKQHDLIQVAQDSIRDDFLFIITYAASISFGLFWLASSVDGAAAPWLLKILLWLGWAQWLAGILDIIENIAMYRMLATLQAKVPLPQIAMICAWPKFLIVLGGLAALLLTALGTLIFPRYFHR